MSTKALPSPSPLTSLFGFKDFSSPAPWSTSMNVTTDSLRTPNPYSSHSLTTPSIFDNFVLNTPRLDSPNLAPLNLRQKSETENIFNLDIACPPTPQPTKVVTLKPASSQSDRYIASSEEIKTYHDHKIVTRTQIEVVPNEPRINSAHSTTSNSSTSPPSYFNSTANLTPLTVAKPATVTANVQSTKLEQPHSPPSDWTKSATRPNSGLGHSDTDLNLSRPSERKSTLALPKLTLPSPATVRQKFKLEAFPVTVKLETPDNYSCQSSPSGRKVPKAPKEKKFECGHKSKNGDKCTMRFYRQDELKRHERTHTGEKPFPCKYCDRFFARSDHVRTHERIHTGERPYPCNFCDKAFARSDERLRHHKVHIKRQAKEEEARQYQSKRQRLMDEQSNVGYNMSAPSSMCGSVQYQQQLTASPPAYHEHVGHGPVSYAPYPVPQQHVVYQQIYVPQDELMHISTVGEHGVHGGHGGHGGHGVHGQSRNSSMDGNVYANFNCQ